MILLIIGFFIIAWNFWDFFHSTFSSNGFGWMSARLNKKLSQFILWTNNEKIYKFSGLLHLLFTFLVWLALLIIGSYLLFLSSEQMVVNANTNAPAGILERFYYTCFTLTTLGIGDFVPGNDLSRLITSLISISGFVMLTTGISYLITVLNGVIAKKSLASYIYGMGNNLNRLYEYCEMKNGESNLINNASQLRQIITSYTSQYWSLPIIHYFFAVDKAFSVEVQVARLYEVLKIMVNKFEHGTTENAEITSLQNAINYLLSMSLGEDVDYHFMKEDLEAFRENWGKYDSENQHNNHNDTKMDALLKSCGWNWKSVYAE